MALQKATTLPIGVELPEAYYRIVRVTLDSPTHGVPSASIAIEGYISKKARDESKGPFYAEVISTNPMVIAGEYQADLPTFDSVFSNAVLEEAGENPTKSAYKYLKQINKFKTATDV